MARNVRIDKEGGAQEMLFRWITYQLDEYPELALLYHIPNGGKRDAKTATILKRQGVKAGVPDLHLPVARGGYHGLYIELKVGDNTTTKKQKDWLFSSSVLRVGRSGKAAFGLSGNRNSYRDSKERRKRNSARPVSTCNVRSVGA